MAQKPNPGTRHGNGPGWGGPAKGAGSGPAKAFTADDPNRVTGVPGDPKKMAARRDQKVIDTERAQLLKDVLFDLGSTEDVPPLARVRASEAWLNRHEGMPIARNVTLAVDDVRALSDDALVAEFARLSGSIGSPTAGDEAPGVPPIVPGILH